MNDFKISLTFTIISTPEIIILEFDQIGIIMK